MKKLIGALVSVVFVVAMTATATATTTTTTTTGVGRRADLDRETPKGVFLFP